MQLGVDHLLEKLRDYPDARLGVLCHAASVNRDGTHILELLDAALPGRVTCVFGPEHGVASAAEDMEHVGDATDSAGRPHYSLYGETLVSLTPTAEMLSHCDVLIVDLQDVGARYYTYIYTMAYCMQACAEASIPVIVCDRPNPIGGSVVEGPLVQQGFTSFVGHFPLPNRHGFTIGEFARYCNTEHALGADLHVLGMHGWQRDQLWSDTGLAWTNPSPNMRSQHAALLYPGMCLLEACNVSEGRGTETPFDHCGAPWADTTALTAALDALALPGVTYQATSFTPHSRKFSGSVCSGLRWQITDHRTLDAYAFGLACMWAWQRCHPNDFGWRTPDGNPPHEGFDAGPYEFVTDRPAIDLLTGSSMFRELVDSGASWDDVKQHCLTPTPTEWLGRRAQYLLY